MFIFSTHIHYLSVRSITHCWTLYYFEKLTKCTRGGRYTQRLKIYYMDESFPMLKNRHQSSFRTSVAFCSEHPYFSFRTPEQLSFRTSGKTILCCIDQFWTSCCSSLCPKERGRKRTEPKNSSYSYFVIQQLIRPWTDGLYKPHLWLHMSPKRYLLLFFFSQKTQKKVY
jgi:hypothetical protein